MKKVVLASSYGFMGGRTEYYRDCDSVFYTDVSSLYPTLKGEKPMPLVTCQPGMYKDLIGGKPRKLTLAQKYEQLNVRYNCLDQSNRLLESRLKEECHKVNDLTAKLKTASDYLKIMKRLSKK